MALVKATLNFEIDGEYFEIYSLTEGHLKCKTCQSIWCSHIRRIIEDGGDASFIWESPETDFEVLTIPFIPSMNTWAEVTVFFPGHFHEPQNGQPARVHLHIPEDGSSHLSDEELFLGSIFPGEGRLVIRSLLYNWFFLRLQDPNTGESVKFTCMARTHKMEQEWVFKEHMENEKTKLAEFWSIFWMDQCMTCQAITADMTAFVPPKSSAF